MREVKLECEEYCSIRVDRVIQSSPRCFVWGMGGVVKVKSVKETEGRVSNRVSGTESVRCGGA